MNKTDLKTGMVVEFRNGVRDMVLKRTVSDEAFYILFVDDTGYLSDSHIRDDLTSYNSNFDVMKVYEPEINNLKSVLTRACDVTLPIWERKEVDWNKVPKDTKVYVRNNSQDEWQPAYFYKYAPLCHPYIYSVYSNGKTSFTSSAIVNYKQIKLYKEN